MIIDAHMHIWKKIDGLICGKVPVKPRGDGVITIGKNRVLGMPATFFDCAATAQRALAEFDAAGVDVGVVVQEYLDGPQNEYLRKVAKKYPDRFFMHALPNFFKPKKAVKEAFELFDQGFRGVKICAGHLAGHLALDDERLAALWVRMADEELVVSLDFDTGEAQVAQVQNILRQHPSLRIAIGHFGLPNRKGWPGQLELCRHKNVYIETGGIVWLYRHEGWPFPEAVKVIRQAKDAVGVEKLMWGFDFPRTMVDFTYRQSLDFVRTQDIGFTEEEKSLFLGGNAARLYKIAPPKTKREPLPLITA